MPETETAIDDLERRLVERCGEIERVRYLVDTTIASLLREAVGMLRLQRREIAALRARLADERLRVSLSRSQPEGLEQPRRENSPCR